LAALATGCSRQDTERLARIGKRVAARAEALTADCQAGLGTSWSGAGSAVGVGSRVAARIRWDKDLAELTIQVHATGSTVELKGTVRELAQRRRAVELAESTTGVEKVNDRLQISEP
jgi:osmotically-inducible protein OsmY